MIVGIKGVHLLPSLLLELESIVLGWIFIGDSMRGIKQKTKENLFKL